MLSFQLAFWIVYYICISKNDFIHASTAISIPIIYTSSHGTNTSIYFDLKYKELIYWESILESFVNVHNLSKEDLQLVVLREFVKYKYSVMLFQPDMIYERSFVSCFNVTMNILSYLTRKFESKMVLLRSSNHNFQIDSFPTRSSYNRLLFLGSYSTAFITNPYIDIRELLWETRRNRSNNLFINLNLSHISLSSKLSNQIQTNGYKYLSYLQSNVPKFIRKNRLIILYQNKGANTGGTMALFTLHEKLVELGFDSYLCDDSTSSNMICTQPPVSALIVTGEWCNGALVDYGMRGFLGRGMQYHLGFHHMSDICVGRITIAVSDYLRASLSKRCRSAYYLGCEMKKEMMNAMASILNTDKDVDTAATVIKENLVLFDPDYLTDYPPAKQVLLSIPLPPDTQIITLKGFSSKEMTLLLQRAKVVIDLAFPGAERLVAEGVLMGAIPIISNRWNAVSDVDYPSVLRVDPSNATEIGNAISLAVRRYDEMVRFLANPVPTTTTVNDIPDTTSNDTKELRVEDEELVQLADGMTAFYGYTLSLWRKAHFTADVIFSSSNLHFILRADSLQDEHACNLQILALVYLFPLASVDLYVQDRLWYIRHHYSFFTAMKEAGYIRHDPFDPTDSEAEYILISQAFIRIFPIDQFSELITTTTRGLSNNSINFNRIWDPILIFLSVGEVFQNPYDLFDTIIDLPELGYIYETQKIINENLCLYNNLFVCMLNDEQVELCHQLQRTKDNFPPSRLVDVEVDSSGSWIAISPYIPFTKRLQDHINIIMTSNNDKKVEVLIGSNNEYTCHSRISLTTISVCQLLENSDVGDRRNKGRNNILFDIVRTVPWMSEVTFLRDTVRKLDRCMIK